jgi:hypothetical protein
MIVRLMEAGGNEKVANAAGRTPYDESASRDIREKFKEVPFFVSPSFRLALSLGAFLFTISLHSFG